MVPHHEDSRSRMSIWNVIYLQNDPCLQWVTSVREGASPFLLRFICVRFFQAMHAVSKLDYVSGRDGRAEDHQDNSPPEARSRWLISIIFHLLFGHRCQRQLDLLLRKWKSELRSIRVTLNKRLIFYTDSHERGSHWSTREGTRLSLNSKCLVLGYRSTATRWVRHRHA